MQDNKQYLNNYDNSIICNRDLGSSSGALLGAPADVDFAGAGAAPNA